MSTLTLVDAGNTGESKSQAVTRRIREELGRVGLTVSAVARLLGESQPKLSRRMTGATTWDVDELGEFCAAAGISYEYVTAGVRLLPPEPPVPHHQPRQRKLAVVGEDQPLHVRVEATDDVAADIDDQALAYLRLAEGDSVNSSTLRLTAECAANCATGDYGVTLPHVLGVAA